MSDSDINSDNKPELSRLAQAIEHVKSNWIPYDKSTLNLIRQSPSAYEMEERSKTISILKQDLGLFTFCIKEILSDPQFKSVDENIAPLDILKLCPSQDLKKILDKAETEIFHRIGSKASDYQDRVLTIPIISAVISKTLAPSVDLDPENTFLVSILRQLGIALIAWNYPSLFEKALKRVGPGCSIEKSLYLVLGFSTLSLALSLAQSLEISDSIKSSLGAANKDLKSQQLRKICKIGEALARSNEQWMDPAAADISKQAMSQAEELIGDSAIEIIEKALEENCGLILDKPQEQDEIIKSTIVKEVQKSSTIAVRYKITTRKQIVANKDL